MTAAKEQAIETTAVRDNGLEAEGMISPKFFVHVISNNIDSLLDFCKLLLILLGPIYGSPDPGLTGGLGTHA